MDVMAVLFLEFPNMQLHYNLMFNSLYIVGSYHFRLCHFSHKDFVIPLFHPAFDPSVPYFAIPLHVAHPAPPSPHAALAALAVAPPTSPDQVVPNLQLNSESDPSEATGSPSSSSGSNPGYSPVGLSMANGFLIEWMSDQ